MTLPRLTLALRASVFDRLEPLQQQIRGRKFAHGLLCDDVDDLAPSIGDEQSRRRQARDGSSSEYRWWNSGPERRRRSM